MDVKSNSRELNCILCQAKSMFISAVMDILAWRLICICCVLEPEQSGQLRNSNKTYFLFESNPEVAVLALGRELTYL